MGWTEVLNRAVAAAAVAKDAARRVVGRWSKRTASQALRATRAAVGSA